eukprot:223233_1
MKSLSTMNQSLTQQQQQQQQQQIQSSIQSQMQQSANTNTNQTHFPKPNYNIPNIPPSLNNNQPSYYSNTPTPYQPHYYNNTSTPNYNNPYHTLHQNPLARHPQFAQENIISLNIETKNPARNKDKTFLLAIQKRYPSTCRYGKLEIIIKQIDEVYSDDDDDDINIQPNKQTTTIEPTKMEIKDVETEIKDIKKEKKDAPKASLTHSDDSIKKVIKWILINNKTDRTKLRGQTGVKDINSAAIFAMLGNIIHKPGTTVYKFLDGIFCGEKIEIGGKCFYSSVRKDLKIDNDRIQRLFDDVIDEVNEKRIKKLKELAGKKSEKKSEKKIKKRQRETNKNSDNNNDIHNNTNNNSPIDNKPPAKKK